MQHLCSVHSRQEAEDIVTHFELNGIPLILSNVDSNRLMMGTFLTVDIWVGIDSQLDEARALLQDPHYTVQHPQDPLAFHQQWEELKSGPNPLSTMAMNFFVCLALLLLVIWVLWSIIS